jgi:hypothetical protein
VLTKKRKSFFPCCKQSAVGKQNLFLPVFSFPRIKLSLARRTALDIFLVLIHSSLPSDIFAVRRFFKRRLSSSSSLSPSLLCSAFFSRHRAWTFAVGTARRLPPLSFRNIPLPFGGIYLPSSLAPGLPLPTRLFPGRSHLVPGPVGRLSFFSSTARRASPSSRPKLPALAMARPVPSPMAPCPTGRDPSMAASSAPAMLSLPSSSARLLSLLARSNSCARRSSPCRAATTPAPGQVSLRAVVRPAPLLAELYPLPMAELPACAAGSLHQRRSSLCPAASLSWSFFVSLCSAQTLLHSLAGRLCALVGFPARRVSSPACSPSGHGALRRSSFSLPRAARPIFLLDLVEP